jgi:hypothetical protein
MALERDSSSLVSEIDHNIDGPRRILCRVNAVAGLVLALSSRDVRRVVPS